MSNPVATVTYVKGQVWAKAPDGSLRPLEVGAQVNADEVIVTADGASVELDFGDGIPVAIAGNQEVSMGRDLWDELAADADEAALEDESVQQALAILEQGGDLLEELEDTAAGLGGGAGGGGISFVQLSRLVIDTPDVNRFEFDDNPATPAALPLQTTQAINYPPTSTDVSLQGDEDTTITGRIPASDPDGDVLTYQIANQPLHGSVVLDPRSGEFVYVPAANYHGTDSFEVSITDGRGNSTSSTVTLTVTAVNDLPVTADLNLNTDEDAAVAGQIVASDLDGDTLAYSLATAPVNGSVTVDPATGAFVYTPDANFNGTDSFIVMVSDGQGGNVSSTVTIGVAALNDAPTTTDLNLNTEEDVAVSGQIMATDVDGDVLSYAVSSVPQNGVLILNAATGEFTYTPNTNYNGTDSFVVTISDGNGGATTSTVTVGVTPVNDVPTVSPIALDSINEDGNLIITQNDLLAGASDIDGDSLTAVNLTLASGNGTLVENGDGTWTFTPSINWNGAVDFAFDVFDGTTTVPNTASLTVLSVNDAPTTANIALTTDEDTAVSGQVTATDIDGDVLSYIATTAPQNGVLILNAATGEFTYTPNTNYNGSDSFVVTISDGNGGTTTSTITVGVAPANDAPTVSPIALSDINEDGNLIITQNDLLVGAGDIDGDALTAINLAVTTGSGSVVDNGDGTWTFTPTADWNGAVDFAFDVFDGTTTVPNTASLTVLSVNDAPTTANIALTTDEDTAVSGQVTATDIDGDVLSYIATTAPQNGVLILNAATGEFTYTPNTNYNGSDSFVVTISDGNGGTTTSTITVGVAPVNDAPVAVADAITTDEDTSIVVDVRANDSDIDGDSLTVVAVTQGTNGSVVIDALSGNPIYTPNSDFNGSDSFTYTISDGQGGTSTTTVNVTVNAVDDPSTLIPDWQNIDEDTTLNGNVLDNDSDVDSSLEITSFSVSGTNYNAGDTATINGVGTLLMLANGDYILTPALNYNGSLPAVAYTTNTGLTSTLNITVDPVNDEPVATALNITTNEDVAVTDQVIATDIDGDSLSYTITSSAANGSVVIDADTGVFTYTPDADYNGSDNFVVTVTDGKGGSSTSTVDIVVTPVADAPTLSANITPVTGENVLPIPGSVGLTQNFYDNISNVDSNTATDPELVEAAVEATAPTSSNIVQDVFLPTVGVDDAYQYSGYIYLEAGSSYQLTGSRDDTLLVKIGGSIVYNAGFDQWGAINGEIREGNWSGAALEFPVTVSGYYSFEVVAYNGNEAGNLNLSLSVDGADSVALSTENFYLYPDASYFSGSIAAGSFMPNGDGGYYPAETNQYTYFLLDIAASAGASGETLGLVISSVPDGVVLTDGANIFTATSLLSSVDVTSWNIEGIQVIPPSAYTGTFGLDITASSMDDTDSTDVTNTFMFEVLSNDFNNMVASPISDTINGSVGADAIYALNGDDTLTGAAGNDYLFGGLGADTFVWNLSDAGSPGAPAVDKVGDFNLAQGDVLHLADLLQGEESHPLTDYLHFDSDGSNTRVHISSNGGYASAGYDASATDQIVVLEGVSLSGTNTEIIAQLQNLNNLQVD